MCSWVRGRPRKGVGARAGGGDVVTAAAVVVVVVVVVVGGGGGGGSGGGVISLEYKGARGANKVRYLHVSPT